MHVWGLSIYNDFYTVENCIFYPLTPNLAITENVLHFYIFNKHYLV